MVVKHVSYVLDWIVFLFFLILVFLGKMLVGEGG